MGGEKAGFLGPAAQLSMGVPSGLDFLFLLFEFLGPCEDVQGRSGARRLLREPLARRGSPALATWLVLIET